MEGGREGNGIEENEGRDGVRESDLVAHAVGQR